MYCNKCFSDQVILETANPGTGEYDIYVCINCNHIAAKPEFYLDKSHITIGGGNE